jgi:nucleotide-binding universal stress UspA family protein
MHKFLIPIDGSPSAMQALEYAIKLAKELGSCEMHILHAQPQPIIYGEIQVYVPLKEMEAMQMAHSQDLLKPALQRVQASGVPHTSEIVVGEAAQTICKRGDELRCDGIIMGTRGMSSIGNLIMGSVATKVIHLAKMPVTLVKAAGA